MPPDRFSKYQHNLSAPIGAAPNERYQKTLSVSLENFEELSRYIENDTDISEDDKNKFATCLYIELIKLIGESGKKDRAGKNIWQPNEIAMLYQTLRKMGLDENTSCSIITNDDYHMRQKLENALSSLDTIPDQSGNHPPNRHRLTNFKTVIQFLKQYQDYCIAKKAKSMDKHRSIDTKAVKKSKQKLEAVKESKQKLLKACSDHKDKIKLHGNNRALYVTSDRWIDENKITPLLRNIIESIEQCHDKDEKIKRESMLFECLLSLGIKEPRLIGQLLREPSNDLCKQQTVIGGTRLDNIHTTLSKIQVDMEKPLDPYAQLTGLLMEFTNNSNNVLKKRFSDFNERLNYLQQIIPKEYTDNGVGVDGLCTALKDSFQSEYEEIQNMLRSCANNPDKIAGIEKKINQLSDILTTTLLEPNEEKTFTDSLSWLKAFDTYTKKYISVHPQTDPIRKFILDCRETIFREITTKYQEITTKYPGKPHKECSTEKIIEKAERNKGKYSHIIFNSLYSLHGLFNKQQRYLGRSNQAIEETFRGPISTP